jgi:endonuclease-3
VTGDRSASGVREIYRRLKARFGPLEAPPRREPLEELILTVLSQNTNDLNRDRAFASMRARYPTWDALAGASVHDLAGCIKVGGLSNVKAPRILAILAEIRAREEGTLNLSWMNGAGTERVRAYLTSLPGVGPKTAACVLAFSLGRPVLPVDTHVFRTAKRLGLLSDRSNPERAHSELDGQVRPDLRVRMHVALIRLGREICHPVRPSCEMCPLSDLCPTAPIFLNARSRHLPLAGGGVVE